MEVAEYKVLNAEEVKESYNSPAAAQRYASYFQASRRHQAKDRREKCCIRRALSPLPAGSRVLDLPCGAGRMYPLLKELGAVVVGADCSPYMVDCARKQAEVSHAFNTPFQDTFQVADALNTGFADKEFDAVVSNRLFHHFSDPKTRQDALRELSRICSGPIVVSFFSAFATDALKFYFKKYVRREVIKDRIPISPFTFAKEVRAAGLKITHWYMARPLISKQWYFVLESAQLNKRSPLCPI